MRDGNNLDTSISYEVSVVPDVAQPIVQGRRLLVSPEAASAVPQTVAALLTPYSTHRTSQSFEHLVAKFAPRYRLAFTLLNEDAADGKTVAGWDIQGALSRHITPALNQLNALHNFTVESQVHFHAPLAFEPYHSSTEEEGLYGVTQEDLTIFVNSAEWTLSSSVSNDPVLHFILFIPSKSHTPLRILDTDNRPAPWNAFVLPQWGGIVLLNLPEDAPSSTDLSATDLDAVFRTFRTQLLTLLGVSDLPTGVASADPKGQLTDWQLDTLYRKRAVENVVSGKETLQSIVKLVDQIPNMPVGQDVKGDVQDALTALEKAYKATFISPTSALRHSSEALSLASRAFFNPGMLALLYFPAEHKYAVYTPLFAPVAVPLIVTVLREVSAWKKARKEKGKSSGEEIEQDEQKSK
ncbi:hypothetical protein EWM64_g1082 [Hericium alpestre]|uniref:GPI transamidase component PIG-S n=1 Tax=Hericium alpestre TaxID=135208 RepID=A0A4Z0A9F7_9AGAM|nr:hypothetical protein EWM64_g1082 [Hericium alpestre]